MNPLTHSLPRTDPGRRAFLETLAKTCLGVTVLPAAGLAAEKASSARQIATAKNVIYLYMTGGMSHLDTFGVVPGADTMGPTKTIPTSADGVLVSEHLPNVARQMHHGAIINSMVSTQGAHEPGNYFAHTSYSARGGARHPSLGAWLTKFQGRGNPTLPGSVVVTPDSRHPGGGFFEASFAPLIIQDAAMGLQNSHRLGIMTEGDLDYRLALTASLEEPFRAAYPHPAVRAQGDTFREALTVMKSADLVAFDIDAESAETRAAYGNDRFSQGCLLARRLVEHGVRSVEVTLGTWDTHVDNFLKTPELCATLDRALAALLADLERLGLLSTTLVVLATEFGRTPFINGNGGRDHHPQAFTTVLWGGGIRGGQVYGKTDRGIEVVEKRVTIPDFNASIAYGLGLPLDTVLYSPAKRPFTIADKGQPVTALFG
jgi:uncharacterized protein (DUF1501 family)